MTIGYRRLATVTTLAAAAMVASPAFAGGAPGPDFAAPYSSSGTTQYADCSGDAVCSVRPAADALTGAVSATTEVTRTDPAIGTDSASSAGIVRQTVKLPPHATTITATFTVHVNSATFHNAATNGTSYGEALLEAAIPACNPGCTSSPTSVLVDNYATSLGVPVPDRQVGPEDITVSVTASARNLPGYVVVVLDARATAQLGETCVDSGCKVVADPLHAGDARTTIDAVVTSVHVDIS